MPRTLDIQIELPDATPEETAELARMKAKEAAILFLQQQGDLTIREAAAALELSYEEYMKLLADRDLPATYDDTDPQTLDRLRVGVHLNDEPGERGNPQDAGPTPG